MNENEEIKLEIIEDYNVFGHFLPLLKSCIESVI
jgi:hypothetical protein